MSSYNIYGIDSDEDGPPRLKVVLNEDDTEVVDVVCDDPEMKKDALQTLAAYVESGATVGEALYRYAGSYGAVYADTSGEDEEVSV